ncbi:50S ribosomal protein L24 [Methylonatrum kenyense]|uniref:50S ribosomal protein L24 n=1 Tax=Methylonatrum kenyense TaxID=455253 RepID=UPI0020C17026|nr:50S ribosomal protein L24 [Methylonatrum kenyense]MCK8516740.1 50S ribosomal protein L24 [Methylonatrum kenyense]
MQKIKKGDDVIVIAGKDKGRRGTVVRVFRDADKVVVENVNVIKKHVKPNPQRGESGGIQEKEAPLHISNIAHYNPATAKADRVGIKVLEDGRKARFYKSNNELVDG